LIIYNKFKYFKMRYQPISNRFFRSNRENFTKQMNENSFAVFYSNDQCPRNGDQYHPFRQNSDFFYLTGIEQEKSILLLAPACPPCFFLKQMKFWRYGKDTSTQKKKQGAPQE